MTRHLAIQEQRMLDLLVDRATEGLGAPESRELDRLLELFPLQDANALDQAAAAIHLAIGEPVAEPLPAPLRDRLLIDAGKYFVAREPLASPLSPAIASAEVLRSTRPGQRAYRAPWYLAAASLVFAVVGWWQVFDPGKSSQPDTPKYDRFLKNPDVVLASWSANDARYTTVSGEVSWSDASQGGYMRFVGLEPNDPKESQYQLWIVDPDRDKHPVDGGVFDVSSSGEEIVPMNAKLHVDTPTTFAVTLEKVGGVVVSEGPLLLVASVKG